MSIKFVFILECISVYVVFTQHPTSTSCRKISPLQPHLQCYLMWEKVQNISSEIKAFHKLLNYLMMRVKMPLFCLCVIYLPEKISVLMIHYNGISQRCGNWKLSSLSKELLKHLQKTNPSLTITSQWHYIASGNFGLEKLESILFSGVLGWYIILGHLTFSVC